MAKNTLNTPKEIIMGNFSRDTLICVVVENALKGRFGPEARGAADLLAQLLHEQFGVTL